MEGGDSLEAARASPLEYVAIVQDVVIDGKKGSYVVTTCDGLEGSVTFSLTTEVWQENKQPEKGNLVILSDVRRTSNGWRAYHARFYRP
jgi:hypothetical protein